MNPISARGLLSRLLGAASFVALVACSPRTGDAATVAVPAAETATAPADPAASAPERRRVAARPLLLRANEPARILEQAARDPLLARVLEQLRRDGEAALAAPPLKDNRAGVDGFLRHTARPLVRRVLTLSFLHRLSPEPRLRDRVVADLLAAAALPDWNDRHFLSAAETGFAVAVGLEWLGDELSREQQEKLRAALVGKLLKPGLRDFRARTFWTQGHGNWTSVCNASLIVASTVVGDFAPEGPETLGLATANFRQTIQSYGPEGGYDEGPMYWSYGTQFLVLGLDAQVGEDGATPAGFDTPGLRGAGWFPIVMRAPNGRFFNYGDAGEQFALDPAGLWIAAHFKLPDLAFALREGVATELDAIEAELSGQAPRVWYRGSERFRVFEAIWLARNGVPEPPGASTPLDFRFTGRPPQPGMKGEAETAVLRGAWGDPLAAFVGIKGGANLGGRGHLDAGTFVYDVDGERWARQLGGDDYNLPGYFVNMADPAQRDRPYVYFRKNTRSKNTLLAANAIQSIDTWAPIDVFESTPALARAGVAFTSAYPERWAEARRQFVLLDRRHLVVTDDIQWPAGGVFFRSQFLSGATVELDGAHAVLRKNGRVLHARIHSPAGARWLAEPATPPTARENQNEGVSVLFFGVQPEPGTAALRLVFSLSPDADFFPAAPASRNEP